MIGVNGMLVYDVSGPKNVRGSGSVNQRGQKSATQQQKQKHLLVFLI